MITPKLKLDLKTRFFLSQEFFACGHYIIRRDIENLPRIFKKLNTMQCGQYSYEGKFLDVDTSQLKNYMPKESRQNFILPDPIGVNFFRSELGKKFKAEKNDCIQSYTYKIDQSEKTVFVNPDYAPLMRLGYAYQSEKNAPIQVFNHKKILIAVIMPMRA